MRGPEAFSPTGPEDELESFAGEVEPKTEEQARLEREWMRPGDIAAWSRVRDRIETMLGQLLPEVAVEFDTIGTTVREMRKGAPKPSDRDFTRASFIFRDRSTLEPFLVERIDSALLDAYGMKPPEEIAADFFEKARKAHERLKRKKGS